MMMMMMMILADKVTTEILEYNSEQVHLIYSLFLIKG
jgi:hypothetical protein